MSNQALKTVKFTPGDITVTVGDYLFAQCYALNDLTLPTLMDKISDHMFFSSKMYYLYIPNGAQSIEAYAFQQSFMATLVIPSSVKSIGMTAISVNLQTIYFCGTEAQWNSISKNGNDQFLKGKTIYYVADVSSVKILNDQNADVQGKTVQMGIGDCSIYKLELTFTEGEKLIDPRYVEWFCVAPNTPTNNIKSIESAASAVDVVGLSLITTNAGNVYSVSLNVSALKAGNASIIGHVKKNPTSSMATNTDHVY